MNAREVSSRRLPCTLAAAAILAVSCSKESVDYDPYVEPTYDGLPLTVTMTSCPYQAGSTDTLSVVLPDLLLCDSTGAPMTVPGQTVSIWYQDSGQKLVMSLMDAVPLIRAVTAGPGFSGEIGAFLDQLASYPASITQAVNGTFRLAVADSGVRGTWSFTGIEPTVLYGLMDSVQQQALASLVTDVNGNAGMLFEFSADTLTGLLSRRTYGDAAIAQVVDTTWHTIHVLHESDSLWTLSFYTTGHLVGVYINQAGDLTWTMGDSTYTYYLRPAVAGECPNRLEPPWLPAIVDANRT